VVLRCKLVCGWGLHETESAPPNGPMWLAAGLYYLLLLTLAVVPGWRSTSWRRWTSTLRRRRRACPTELSRRRVGQTTHLLRTPRSRRTRCCPPNWTARRVDSRRPSDRHESLGCALVPRRRTSAEFTVSRQFLSRPRWCSLRFPYSAHGPRWGLPSPRFPGSFSH